jgi:hypothetical protein
MHPALLQWQEAKGNKGRPGISDREREARRLVVLMNEGLRRIGLSESHARRTAADAATHYQLFNHTISASTVKHWRERDYPILFPRDEQLLATGIATAGLNPGRLVTYFVGLCHLAGNPSAVLARSPMGRICP